MSENSGIFQVTLNLNKQNPMSVYEINIFGKKYPLDKKKYPLDKKILNFDGDEAKLYTKNKEEGIKVLKEYAKYFLAEKEKELNKLRERVQNAENFN